MGIRTNKIKRLGPATGEGQSIEKCLRGFDWSQAEALKNFTFVVLWAILLDGLKYLGRFYRKFQGEAPEQPPPTCRTCSACAKKVQLRWKRGAADGSGPHSLLVRWCMTMTIQGFLVGKQMNCAWCLFFFFSDNLHLIGENDPKPTVNKSTTSSCIFQSFGRT